MPDTKAEEAVNFLHKSAEAEGENRAQGLADLKFSFGDQWPVEMINSRKLQDRPWLTINETDTACRQVINQIRQQRPRIRAHAINNGADVKIADVVTGLVRHVEVNSDADNAYDTAAEFTVRMGWGYWRLRTDYVREDSFDQDIFIDAIPNPFSVYFDPMSELPDGSDAEKCLITDLVPLATFRKMHPGRNDGQGFTASAAGDPTAAWITKDSIRLAEYFRIDREAMRLVKLSDGRAVWEDKMPTPELMRLANLTIIGERQSFRRAVYWCKVTAFETLDEKKLPGRWIPVVPCYGVTLNVDGRRKRFGMVRQARDPQQMVNYWQTAITESVALAPKAKWVMAEGQDEGFEREWQSANNSALPVLHYKVKSLQGQPVGAPQRIQPEPPPEGAMMAAMAASQSLQRVLGIYDPGVRASATHKSDKTINAEAQQTEISNFHFYDNITRSQKHTGRIILDWVPIVWDTPDRVQRIIGADGRAKLVTLNQKTQTTDPQTGMAVLRVLNDVTVGLYDVEMETGPGYNSRRQEAVAVFTSILDTPLGEKIAQVADDVIVRQMDVPGADVVADRLAAMNPLSQIDEESDIPPQAQMMILGLRKQVQTMGQQLQQAGIEIKFGLQKEAMRQDGETRRTLITQTTKAHDIETIAATKRHDTETRAVTAQNVEEIKGIVQLFMKHLSTADLQREIEARDAEQRRQAEADAAMPQGPA